MTTSVTTNKTQKNFSVVITAAGNSTRMQSSKKKEYLPFPNSKNNSTILSECIFKFLQTKLFNSIIVTVPESDLNSIEEIIFEDTRISKAIQNSKSHLLFTAGGKSRQESVFNALLKLESDNCAQAHKSEFVLIHDGARPFLSEELIKTVCKQTEEKGSAIPATPAVDTQKVIDEQGKITQHLKRSTIFAVQTPQGFNFAKLLQAHQKAKTHKKEYTDDSEIYALLKEDVFTCEGETSNKKITYKEDL